MRARARCARCGAAGAGVRLEWRRDTTGRLHLAELCAAPTCGRWRRWRKASTAGAPARPVCSLPADGRLLVVLAIDAAARAAPELLPGLLEELANARAGGAA